MRTCTFAKRFTSALLVIALLLPIFVSAQTTKPSDFLRKTKKSGQEQTLSKKKITPKMMQMKRTIKSSQTIPSATNLIKSLPHQNFSKSALAVTESGATLYGNLIYSSAWADLSEVGFHYINPNTGSYIPIATSEYFTGAGTVVDGIAYISYSGMYTNELLTIVFDINSSTFVNVIEHDPSDYTSYAVNMSYNYVDNTIYALVFDEDGVNYRLSKFNPETFSYVKIADIIITEDIFAMAFDDKGTLYIMCSEGEDFGSYYRRSWRRNLRYRFHSCIYAIGLLEPKRQEDTLGSI